jgi:hypothetical protein
MVLLAMACLSREDLACCDDQGVASCIAGTTVVAWIHEPNIMVLTKRKWVVMML